MQFLQNCDAVAGAWPPGHLGKLAPLLDQRGEVLDAKEVVKAMHHFERLLLYGGDVVPPQTCLVANATWAARQVPHTPPRIGALAAGARRLRAVQPSREPFESSAPLIRFKQICHCPAGVVMVSTGESQWSGLSVANKRNYAQRHGYGFHVFGDIDPARAPAWHKLPALLSVAPLYDWLWCVDDDTLVMNASVALETFVDPRYELVLAMDSLGMNTGSFFVQTSPWARLLLLVAHTRTQGPRAVWADQAALIELSEDFRVRNRMKLVPNRAFNGYAYGGGNAYVPGDFLVHFPGEPPDVKRDRFMHFWAQTPAGQKEKQTESETV
jgi:hypothetical protein